MAPVTTTADSLVAAGAATDGGMALITCQPATRFRDRGWSVPADARGVTSVSAYYESRN